MGHEIEKIARGRGHVIVATPDKKEDWKKIKLSPESCDVVIDFSTPDSAEIVVNHCLNSGVAVVTGTTGWSDRLEKSKVLCNKTSGALFHAPNFSIGVNIFFEINRKLAQMISGHNYKARLNEIHHIHKLDAPSGTAIALANDIIASNKTYSKWISGNVINKETLPVFSERTGEVPGTHLIEWSSDTDSIEIKHTAHSRTGFAIGAVLAAEWISGKSGVFGMSDLLNSTS